MLRIVILLLLLAVVIGCYPPSYYDPWNARSVERYLDWYDSYYPDTYSYYNPYYYGYPYYYFPFSFSLYYSYDKYHYDYPDYGHHRRSPYDSHRYRGWWRK